MISRRTVFVVGAGASKEVDLPIGSELAAKIAYALRFKVRHGQLDDGDGDLYDAIRSMAGDDVRPFFEAANAISSGIHLTNSIDNFLDIHNDRDAIRHCGKLAIVRTMLAAERSSKMFSGPNPSGLQVNFSGVRDTWFVSLFKIIQDGVRKSNLSDLLANTTFVIFNYDRCVEHFLLYAIRECYRVTDQGAAKALSACTFIHPYGDLGLLPWQPTPTLVPHMVPYGAEAYGADLVKLSDRIRTFTEQVGEESTDLIRQKVSEADHVFFLGFSYGAQNLSLLAAPKTKAKRVYGTGVGLSQSDAGHVENRLRELFPSCAPEEVKIERALSAQAFVGEFGRTIGLPKLGTSQ